MSSPRNVNITKIENRSAQVIWDAPPCAERNGEITSYKYHIRGLRFSSLDLTKNTHDNSPSTELTGLTPYATYSFKVTAVSGAGPGPNYSQQVIFTTKADGRVQRYSDKRSYSIIYNFMLKGEVHPISLYS